MCFPVVPSASLRCLKNENLDRFFDRPRRQFVLSQETIENSLESTQPSESKTSNTIIQLYFIKYKLKKHSTEK